MCCFQDALQNACGFMDPYGDMPLAGGMTASAEIDIMDTENGVHVSVVKTPPRNGRIRLSEVIESLIGRENGLECAADQAKCKPNECLEKPDDSGKMDSRKPPKPPEDAKPGDKPEESEDLDDKDSWRKEKK